MWVSIDIQNLPEDIHTRESKNIVVRFSEMDKYKLWYYGAYESSDRAGQVAKELGNAFVVERVR